MTGASRARPGDRPCIPYVGSGRGRGPGPGPGNRDPGPGLGPGERERERDSESFQVIRNSLHNGVVSGTKTRVCQIGSIDVSR